MAAPQGTVSLEDLTFDQIASVRQQLEQVECYFPFISQQLSFSPTSSE